MHSKILQYQMLRSRYKRLFNLCWAQCLRNYVHEVHFAEHGEQSNTNWCRNSKRKECHFCSFLFENAEEDYCLQFWSLVTLSRWDRFEVFRRRRLTFRIGWDKASFGKWLMALWTSSKWKERERASAKRALSKQFSQSKQSPLQFEKGNPQAQNNRRHH